MKLMYMLFAAALMAGLAVASSQMYAAGPMVAPGALATSSAGALPRSLNLRLLLFAGAPLCAGLWCAGA